MTIIFLFSYAYVRCILSKLLSEISWVSKGGGQFYSFTDQELHFLLLIWIFFKSSSIDTFILMRSVSHKTFLTLMSELFFLLTFSVLVMLLFSTLNFFFSPLVLGLYPLKKNIWNIFDIIMWYNQLSQFSQGEFNTESPASRKILQLRINWEVPNRNVYCTPKLE